MFAVPMYRVSAYRRYHRPSIDDRLTQRFRLSPTTLFTSRVTREH